MPYRKLRAQRGRGSLAVSAVILIVPVWLAFGSAASAAGSPRTISSDVTESWLVSRGLIEAASVNRQSVRQDVQPPPGAEVDEARQFTTSDGQELMRIKSWDERLGDDSVHIEVTTLPGHQYEVGFWLFGKDRRGCDMFGKTLYDGGRLLKSVFWRNDPGLRLMGAVDLPGDLYPDSIPAIAFLRALEAPRGGAVGMLHQQLTPYSYVGQNVYAADTQPVHVPAGDFSAIKVTAQADVSTLMPHWPHFVLRVIRPFVPSNTIYFQSTPPYRLLKQQGTTYVGGPEVTTELLRYYFAPSSH